MGIDSQVIPEKMVVVGSTARVVGVVADQDEKSRAFVEQVYIDIAAKCLDQGLIPVS